MKLTKQQLREIIKEELKYLQLEADSEKLSPQKFKNQELIEITRKNLLKSIKARILVAIDLLESSKRDKDASSLESYILRAGIDELKIQINKSHPDIILNIKNDIKNLLEEIKKEIEFSTPEKINDFEKIASEYNKLADEYQY